VGDETDQPLKDVVKHFDITKDDLLKWHCRQNSLIKRNNHLSTDKENKENHICEHAVSYARSSQPMSLQVIHYIHVTWI